MKPRKSTGALQYGQQTHAEEERWEAKRGHAPCLAARNGSSDSWQPAEFLELLMTQVRKDICAHHHLPTGSISTCNPTLFHSTSAKLRSSQYEKHVLQLLFRSRILVVVIRTYFDILNKLTWNWLYFVWRGKGGSTSRRHCCIICECSIFVAPLGIFPHAKKIPHSQRYDEAQLCKRKKTTHRKNSDWLPTNVT